MQVEGARKASNLKCSGPQGSRAVLASWVLLHAHLPLRYFLPGSWVGRCCWGSSPPGAHGGERRGEKLSPLMHCCFSVWSHGCSPHPPLFESAVAAAGASFLSACQMGGGSHVQQCGEQAVCHPPSIRYWWYLWLTASQLHYWSDVQCELLLFNQHTANHLSA